MISRCFVLVLSVVAFAPDLLRAQQPIQRAGPILAVDIGSDDGSADLKMHEDIEIFRRILDRKLQPLYPRTHYAQQIGSMMGMQGMGMGGMGMMGMQPGMAPNNWMMPNNTIWHQEVNQTLEGVYLKGHGVVYTATLSSLQPPKSSAKAETPKPVSEWETARREVRNQKEPPKTPAPSKAPELSDLLLRTLAENGQYFSRLSENESLTIVITVHERNQPAPTRKSAEKPAKSASQAPSGGGGSSTPSKVRDLELLGDLHMKQEHYGQARDAFREAIALKPGRDQTAALARKLAQAYLMLYEIEAARSALDQAIALSKKDTDAKDKPAAKSASLPVKLIISAPKKLLDQAGEKKISFEEFRRRVSVESRTFGERRR